MTDRIKELETLIRDNFDDDTITLDENTQFDEIEEWDSMEQVNIITLVEEYYGFKFTVGEMTAMSTAKSVKEMTAIIAAKAG